MMQRYLLLLLLVVLGADAGAQVFPVQLTQQVDATGGRLSDFSSPALDRYRLSLQLMDPRESSVQVVLRLRIEGNNLRIASRAGMAPVLHSVDFGAPLTLTGSDLTYLFAPANLDVAGIGTEEFWQGGGLLSEGFYTICIEAFLPARAGQAGVSDENCVPLFLTVNEPPLVTYPIANQVLDALEPQNFAITWEEQGQAGGPVSYDLEITPYGTIPGAEGDPPGGGLPIGNGGFGVVQQSFSPFQSATQQSAFGSNNLLPLNAVTGYVAPLIFRTDLMSPAYQIQPGDPQLQRGRQYVVRVRATDPLGNRSYRNGGWSQPVVFTYGSPCPSVSGVAATPISDQQVEVRWSATGAARGYTLRFQDANQISLFGQANVYEQSSQQPYMVVDRLRPATRYRYWLTANCGGSSGEAVTGYFNTPGPPQTLVYMPVTEGNDTPPPPGPTVAPSVAGAADQGDPFDKPVATCDPNATLVGLSSGTPDNSRTLAVEEQFEVAGLNVRVKTVSGSGGSGFTGTGTLLIPWLDQGALAVGFSNLRLDANGAMVSGSVTPARGKEKLDATQLTATFGPSEECANYTEVILDERGFDANGIHYITGTTLDPYEFDKAGNFRGQPNVLVDENGFNAAGIHQTTQTEYNEAGCNRDGLNDAGQPCISGVENAPPSNDIAPAPAPTIPNVRETAVLDKGSTTAGAATQYGSAYSSQTSDSELEAVVAEAIDSLLLDIDNITGGFQFLQQAGSAAVQALVWATDLEREILLGPNDELLEPGMSARYNNNFPELDLTGESLAYKTFVHGVRAIYDLDRYTIDTLQPLRTLYVDHQSGTALDELTGHVRGHLEAASQIDTTGWSFDQRAFFRFVQQKVRRKVSELFTTPSAGYGSWTNPAREARNHLDPERALASAAGEWIAPPPIDIPSKLRDYGITNYDPVLGWKLPIKLEDTLGGKRYTIFIEDIRFSPAGIQTDVMMVLPAPGKDGEYLAFEGTNIPLSAGGFTGTQRIGLVSEVKVGLGTYGTMTLDNNGENYVEFSCSGYEGFQLKGEVLFCRDKVMPLDDDGELIADQEERVTGLFQVSGDEWPNFLTKIDIKDDARFAVTGLREVHWEADEIWLDFSETQKATGVTFPEGYTHAHVSNNQPDELWRGVHVTRLRAELDFLNEKSRQQKKLGFEAENLIIDNSGLSVKVTADNIVARDGTQAPKAGKWDIAVDTVVVGMMQSAFQEARIVGDVILPNEDRDKVGYVGQASEGAGFSFSATLLQPKTFSWESWKGQLTMQPNTSFEMLKDANIGGWGVRARLYGNLALGVAPTDKFKVPDVAFSDFRLASFAPYIDLGPNGSFGIRNGAVTLSGFSIELDRLEFVKRNKSGRDQFGIAVDAGVSLLGGTSGFSGSGGATVWGEVDATGDRLAFDYQTVKVHDIGLGVKIPGVMISGNIKFIDEEEDPVRFAGYGKGFQGSLVGQFDGVAYELAVAGMFGRVANHPYFFVDGMVGFPIASSIPIVTPLHITGFGGGVYYHMTRAEQGLSTQTINFFSQDTPEVGEGLSGVRYVPTSTETLGLKLMCNIATFPSAALMNGSAMLEAQFDLGKKSLQHIAFNGSAAFLTPTKPNGHPLPNTSPVLAVDLAIMYKHTSRTLDATLDGYLNYLGTIVGANTNPDNGRGNHIGQILFHASPGKWKLWMGQPSQGSRLAIELKPVKLEVGTYLDMGTELPAFPGLPPLYAGLNLNPQVAPAGMSGFMHGFDASFPAGGGSKTFKAWRIGVDLGVNFGYNVLMTNSLACAGRSNFGLSNWYLKGNAYAYMHGGVKFDYSWDNDFSKTKTLISLKALAAVQLEAPNPTFMAGSARIEYDVMGWDGSKRVSFSFGDNCTLIDVPPSPLEMQLNLPFQSLIASTYPASGARNFDPEQPLEVQLNGEYEDWFTVDHNGTDRRFRIVEVPGRSRIKSLTDPNWDVNVLVNGPASRGRFDVIFRNKPARYKYGQEYEWTVAFQLEENVNNSWVVFEEDGEPYIHERVVKFSTEPVPDFEAISSIYPTDGTNAFSPVDSMRVDVRFGLMRSFLQQRELIKSYSAEIRANPDTVLLERLNENGTVVEVDQVIVTRKGRDRYPYFDLLPENTLRGESTYRMTVSFSFDYQYEGNDNAFRWREVELAGDEYRQREVVTFTTGPRPDKLEPFMVSRAYPEHLQYNTYRDQRSGESYLKLTQAIDRILGREWLYAQDSLEVRYVDNVTDQVIATQQAEVGYDHLRWPAIPAALGLDRTYRLDIVVVDRVKTAAQRNGSNGLLDEAAALDDLESGRGAISAFNNAFEQAGRRSDNALPLGKVLYTSHFRTSAYPTFSAKVAALNLGNQQKTAVSGVQSPQYVYSPFQLVDDTSSVWPYVENLTPRDLAYAVTRESSAPGELFSDREINSATVDHTSITLSYAYDAYYRSLTEDVFNFVTTAPVYDCMTAGGATDLVTIRESPPTQTLRLLQAAVAPVLEPTSGHDLSLLNGGTPPAVLPADPVTQQGAFFPTVEELKEQSLFIPGLESILPDPPNVLLALRTTLPYAAQVQYNNSWLYRYRALYTTKVNPCDFEGNNGPTITDADLQMLEPIDYGGYIQEVDDAMKAAQIAEQYGFGLNAQNGLGGQPGLGQPGLIQNGTTPTVTLNHTAGGVQTLVSTGIGPEGVTATFGAASTDMLFHQGQVADQQMSQPIDVMSPNSGFSTEYTVPFILRRAMKATNDITMPPLPDPTGATIRGRIVYSVTDLNGTAERYPSLPIDLTAN